ncbi:metallophosphoesterase [Pasteurella canis]|uniref:Metallophosphoesterase n=1 Tax=Pasteurella canis TaxID=753 RepID=A0A379ERT8_9PAST|nr:metallophosphoesterase [Pasteurella canis]
MGKATGNHATYTAESLKYKGKRIAGLGGVFRGQIWMPPNKPLFLTLFIIVNTVHKKKIWRGGIPLRHRTSIFPSDIETLEKMQADILICHEAPRPHPSGFSVINELAYKMNVRHIFHGHHHENFDYDSMVDTYSYQITNVGFRSVCDINGGYLLKGIDER